MAKAELEHLVVADEAELRRWLIDNHESSPGVWLALTKKGGTVTSLTWQQAVDQGLCFGWIDGQGAKRDDETSSIRFTPRGPKSMWSQRNVANVERLEKAKLPTLSQTLHSNKGEIVRVRSGPFAKQRSADQAAAKIRAMGMEATVFHHAPAEGRSARR